MPALCLQIVGGIFVCLVIFLDSQTVLCKRTAANGTSVMWQWSVGGGGGAFCSHVIMSQSLGESLHLNCKFHSVSLSFFSPSHTPAHTHTHPVTWDWVARKGWSWVLYFSQFNQLLIIPLWAGFWLISVSWGRALLRITEYSGILQNGSFSFFPVKSMRLVDWFVFPDINCEIMEVNLTELWDPPSNSVRLELWTLEVARTEPSAARVSPPRPQLPWWFLPLKLCSGESPWLPVFTCLSLQACGQQFAWAPTSRAHPRRAADASDCSAFYLLAPSGKFKTPHGWNCDKNQMSHWIFT